MYLLIENIPGQFRTPELRNFFSELIEKETFKCFHFRHRPQEQFWTQIFSHYFEEKSKESSVSDDAVSRIQSNCQSSPLNRHSSDGNVSSDPTLSCCIIEVSDSCVPNLTKSYHNKHWVDRNGCSVIHKCQIVKLVLKTKKSVDCPSYQTRGENGYNLALNGLASLIEFRPPPTMPQGNIGTPTAHFQALIKTCQLPGSVISKLGLMFSRSRGRKKYSQVQFNYGTKVMMSKKTSEEEQEVLTGRGQVIPDRFDPSIVIDSSIPNTPNVHVSPTEEELEEGAEVEEWDRYESFHNDVTSQERTKERRFESELEVVWEKGGSGLVFYTDAQHWREQEGDFDEQTADEWDVDMSVYYGEGVGDMDARESASMVTNDQLKSGVLTESVFIAAKDKATDNSKKRRKGCQRPPAVGSFEAHTRGFGRRLMQMHGWKDGYGLGRGCGGMAYALEGDGQHPRDKKGFGFHGERLQGWGVPSGDSNTTKRRPESSVVISTVFDEPKDVDPRPSHLRSCEATKLSHLRRNFMPSSSKDLL